jgi:hypothetical protein
VPLFPNGIAFGVDDRLYVAQSMTQKILVMDSVPEPTIKEFATLPKGYPGRLLLRPERPSSTARAVSATSSSCSIPTGSPST